MHTLRLRGKERKEKRVIKGTREGKEKEGERERRRSRRWRKREKRVGRGTES